MASALIVFGHRDTREVYGQFLRHQGFLVYEASHPSGALTELETGIAPDVVVCEVILATQTLTLCLSSVSFGYAWTMPPRLL
jgi:hypothetical protein